MYCNRWGSLGLRPEQTGITSPLTWGSHTWTPARTSWTARPAWQRCLCSRSPLRSKRIFGNGFGNGNYGCCGMNLAWSLETKIGKSSSSNDYRAYPLEII